MPSRQLDPIANPAAAAGSPSQDSTTKGVPNLTTALAAVDGSQDQGPEGPYQPQLSKHERQLMQQAHERHRANITSKQVHSFLTEPQLCV